MKKYNYLEDMKNEITGFIAERISLSDYTSIAGLRHDLREELSMDENYLHLGLSTRCNYEAEKCLLHNWDLLEETLDSLGGATQAISRGPKWCDANIRFYLLPQAIREATDDMGLVELNGVVVKMQQCVNLMDDEIRESVHKDLSPCSNQDFLVEYCRRHEKKFGERFTI